MVEVLLFPVVIHGPSSVGSFTQCIVTSGHTHLLAMWH